LTTTHFFAASLLYNVTIYILKEGCTAPVVIGSADSDRSVVLGYVSSCSNDIYDQYVSLIASTISTTSMATAASVPDEQSSGTSSTTVQSTTRTATATAGPNAESKTLSYIYIYSICVGHQFFRDRSSSSAYVDIIQKNSSRKHSALIQQPLV